MPLNSNYMLLGIDSSTFMPNSGSFFIIMGIILCVFFAKMVFNWLAVLHAHQRLFRQLGIWLGSDSNKIMSPLLKLVMETYFDITLAVFLQTHFTFSVSKNPAESMGGSASNMVNICLNFFLLGVVIVFPVAMRSIIKASGQNTTKAIKIRAQFHIFIEGVVREKAGQSMFHFFFIARRLVSAAVLVFLDQFPYLQISVLMLLSCYNMVYLVAESPLNDKRENTIEAFNEMCILLFCYLVATSLNEANPQSLNNLLGFCLIALTSLNIVVNVCLVMTKTFSHLFGLLKNFNKNGKKMPKNNEFDSDLIKTGKMNRERSKQVQSSLDFD